MSPWLFTVFFDRVVKRVTEKGTGEEMKLRAEKGRR